MALRAPTRARSGRARSMRGGPGGPCAPGGPRRTPPWRWRRPGVACDGGERRMGAVTPVETLGTLYNICVGTNKTKQHMDWLKLGV